MEKSTQINCPKCGHKFIVEDVLTRQIEEKYKGELNQKISEIESKYREKEKSLSEKEQELTQKLSETKEKYKIELDNRIIEIKNEYQKKELSLSEKEQELRQKQSEIDKKVEEKLKLGMREKTKEIKKQVEEEFENQIKTLSEENENRRSQIKDLRNTQIENEQLKRKIDEQKQELETEFEKKMTEKLKAETDKIRERESEKVELKLKEKDELVEALKTQLDIAIKKADQGSMQLQGEVQEIALAERLKSLSEEDVIEEIAKGVKGADIIHNVVNNGCECGKILYESKRTKSFNNSWIQKLKNDAIGVKADICVIVTEAMPDGTDKIRYLDGVWICTLSDSKGLALLLRESLIAISAAYTKQSNKGEKMQMLYDYLTSNECKLQLLAITEGYSNLQASYIKERKQMERIWKEREKQLERILLNANYFIGSIQGIAGSSIPELHQISESENC